MRRRPSERGQFAGIGLQGARSDRHSGCMKTLPFGGGREITMSIEGPQGLSPARGYSPPASGLALLPLTVSMLAPFVRSADSRSGLGVACR